mmetsp:Transcript_21613/g.67011  ORF Transcript_21613/g.67011 Transcript_21613/m.67011 type:complete len:226 (-) Transcript_21613:8-685(-)
MHLGQLVCAEEDRRGRDGPGRRDPHTAVDAAEAPRLPEAQPALVPGLEAIQWEEDDLHGHARRCAGCKRHGKRIGAPPGGPAALVGGLRLLPGLRAAHHCVASHTLSVHRALALRWPPAPAPGAPGFGPSGAWAARHPAGAPGAWSGVPWMAHGRRRGCGSLAASTTVLHCLGKACAAALQSLVAATTASAVPLCLRPEALARGCDARPQRMRRRTGAGCGAGGT